MVVGLFGFSFCGFVFCSLVPMNADSLGNLRHTHTHSNTSTEKGKKQSEGK